LNKYDLVVIGGGISGLVAAYKAKKAGLSILLFDQNQTLGGCLKSKINAGFTLETGANTIALNDATNALLNELKLDQELIFPAVPKYKQYIWDNKQNKPVALPKSPLQLATTKLFNLSEKIQIVCGLFKKFKPSELDTIDGFFSTLLGASATQKAISPALRGIFGGDSSKLLAQKTFPTIFEAISSGKSLFGYATQKKPKRKIFALKEGNSQIVNKLSNFIGSDCIQYSNVDSINLTNGLFQVTYNGDNKVLANKVVVATSGSNTSQIVKSFDPLLADELNKLQYAPIVSIHFSLKSAISELENGFGVLFPKESGSKIIGVLCNSTLFPHTSPADKNLITVCLGGVGQEELIDKDESELIDIATNELSKFFNIQNPTHLLTTFWKKAIPQFTKETINLETKFMEAESRQPNIAFVGVDRGKIGVPDRIDYVTTRMKSFLGS
jgi:oxygen-dependent protoporphyrinogen oxidase